MLEQGGLGAGEALHAGRAEGGTRLLQSPPRGLLHAPGQGSRCQEKSY